MSEPNSDCPPAQPVPQHEWLMGHVGTWNVHCKFYMDPSQPPMEVRAKDTCVAHGRFFTVGRFEADMFGTPFSGIATVGYDPAQEVFVSTWIDTMSPHLFHFTGQLDAAGKVLEMTGRAPEPQSGQMTDWRTTEAHLDDGSRVMEMFMTVPGGPEIKLFTHHYVKA